MTQLVKVDLKGHTCIKCLTGVLVEKSIYDDLDGVLRCSLCPAIYERYILRKQLESK